MGLVGILKDHVNGVLTDDGFLGRLVKKRQILTFEKELFEDAFIKKISKECRHNQNIFRDMIQAFMKRLESHKTKSFEDLNATAGTFEIVSNIPGIDKEIDSLITTCKAILLQLEQILGQKKINSERMRRTKTAISSRYTAKENTHSEPRHRPSKKLEGVQVLFAGHKSQTMNFLNRSSENMSTKPSQVKQSITDKLNDTDASIQSVKAFETSYAQEEKMRMELMQSLLAKQGTRGQEQRQQKEGYAVIIGRMTKEMEQLREELRIKNSEIQKLEQHSAEWQAKYKESLSKIESVQQAKAVIGQTLDKNKQELQKIQTQLHAKLKDLEQLQKEKLTLEQEKTKQAETIKTERQDKVRAVEHVATTAKQEQEKLDKTIKELEASIARFKVEVQQKETLVTNAEVDLKKRDIQISELLGLVQSLQAKLQSAGKFQVQLLEFIKTQDEELEEYAANQTDAFAIVSNLNVGGRLLIKGFEAGVASASPAKPLNVQSLNRSSATNSLTYAFNQVAEQRENGYVNGSGSVSSMLKDANGKPSATDSKNSQTRSRSTT